MHFDDSHKLRNNFQIKQQNWQYLNNKIFFTQKIDFQFSLDSIFAPLFFDDDEGRFPQNWWTFTAANLAFKIAIHPKNEHRSMSLPSKQNIGLLKFTSISWKPPWISEHVLMGKFWSNFTFYILIVKQMGFLIVRVTCEIVGWIWNWICFLLGFQLWLFGALTCFGKFNFGSFVGFFGLIFEPKYLNEFRS
jgi:hypothetical protein